MLRKIGKLTFVAILLLVLGACGTNKNKGQETNKNQDTNNKATTESTDHNHMNHESTGDVPTNVKKADKPTYPIGSTVILTADHVNGMKGAKATIVGAYNTIAYVVSYTPTTGGPRVENHKWVIQEEIKDAVSDKPIKTGTEVIVESNHLTGMKGAKAKIVSADQRIVYMVDYTPTTGGEVVKNHKWVTESEIAPESK